MMEWSNYHTMWTSVLNLECLRGRKKVARKKRPRERMNDDKQTNKKKWRTASELIFWKSSYFKEPLSAEKKEEGRRGEKDILAFPSERENCVLITRNGIKRNDVQSAL